jgi:hypothetical protein
VYKNVVRAAGGEPAFVDWTGGGVGPRTVSLAYALGWKASAAQVVRGYQEHVELTDEEWERLPGVLAGRQLINLCFRLGLATEQAPALAKKLTSIQREARALVAAARGG